MPIDAILPAVEMTDGYVYVRPWRASDAPYLFDAVQSSAVSVGRWLPWCHAGYTLEDAIAWISHCDVGWSRGEHFAFALLDHRSGELMGGAGLSQYDRGHQNANLGYWVRHSRQGDGIAARAAMLVARFGFERLALIRIEVVIQLHNLASRRTAEKAGAQFEAIARQRLWVQGEGHDAAIYPLTSADVSSTR